MSHEVQLTFVLSAAEAARLLSLLDSVPEDAADDGAVTGTTGEAAKRGRGRPRKVEVAAAPTPAAPAPVAATVDYQKMRADLVPQMMAASKTDEGKAKLLAMLQKHGGANKLSSVTNERLVEFKNAFDAAFAAPASDDMFA